MRKIIHPKIRLGYIAISITLTFLLFLMIFSIPQVSGVPGDELLIQITKDNEPIEEINGGEFFTVSVLDPYPEGYSPFLRDVFIKFNEETYHITLENENAEISIETPSVYENKEYTINASKEGYISNETKIKVLKNELPKLLITPEKFTVDANERFSVVITDVSTGEPVENVAVAISEDSGGETQYTNEQGRVWLTAPEKPGEITIIAQKGGEYQQNTEKIEVNKPDSFWDDLFSNKYFFVAVAAILLICAIIFVNIRSRRNIYDRAKEISNEKMIKRHEMEEKDITKSEDKKDISNVEGFSGKPVRSQSENDSKVEEIRISRPRKEKEVVKVETDEDKADKIVTEKRIKKKDYDWFEGTDDMRYEIDKLTGEVDEEGIDKWFEGVGDLKDKINEKVKKKDKKKKEEKEE